MKMVELGKICKIVSGSTPSRNTPEFWDGDIHWFTPKDLSGLASKYVYEAPEKISKEGFRSCSTNLIPSDSLLFSSRAPIGHLAINKLECCTNQGFKTMIPSENLNVEYLYYAIKRIVPQLQDMGNGATFKELSKSTFEKVEIPLPPLATQQKIAAILDAADAYRQLTKTLIAKYDQLAQSLFLDMFGDFDNSNCKKLEGSINIIGGFAFKSTDFVDEGIPVIKIGTVNKGYFDLKTFSFMPKTGIDRYKKWIVYPNDLLISLTGTVGKDDYANIEIATNDYDFYLLNQRVAKIEILNSYNRSFLYYLFKQSDVKRKLTDTSRGVRQANVSNNDIYNLELIRPSIALQNQFAERIQLLEAQKQQAQASLQKAEDLFNSLLQRCFDSAQQPVTAP